jgi:hypothetical protein
MDSTVFYERICMFGISKGIEDGGLERPLLKQFQICLRNPWWRGYAGEGTKDVDCRRTVSFLPNEIRSSSNDPVAFFFLQISGQHTFSACKRPY